MPWSDDDLEALARRLDDVENIAEVADRLIGAERATRKAVDDVRVALDDLRRHVDERLDRVDGQTGALVLPRPDGTYVARPGGLDWKTVLAIASTVVVPIVVAIITTS